MGKTDWPETAKELSGELRYLRAGASDVMKAFSAIAQAALAPKALDAKTKELIALAIGVTSHCDDCIAFTTKADNTQASSLFRGGSADETPSSVTTNAKTPSLRLSMR